MRIVLKNLLEGGSYDISERYGRESAYKELIDAELNGDIAVSGSYCFVNDELIVRLSASYSVAAHCDLCGELTDAASYCVLNEVFDKDSAEYDSKDDSIDLDPLIRECIVLAAARTARCKDDCKGLCPICGANLNKGQCDCAVKRLGETSPFGILKRLINTGGARDGSTKK